MANYEEDDLEQVEDSHKPFCPKCGSTDIRASQTHRTLDHLLKGFSLRPWRCRSCRKRFYMRRTDNKMEEFESKERKEEHELKESPPTQ